MQSRRIFEIELGVWHCGMVSCECGTCGSVIADARGDESLGGAPESRGLGCAGRTARLARGRIRRSVGAQYRPLALSRRARFDCDWFVRGADTTRVAECMRGV